MRFFYLACLIGLMCLNFAFSSGDQTVTGDKESEIKGLLDNEINENSKILVNTYPDDLPIPIVDILNKPSPEGIFLTPFGPAAQDTGKYKNYLMILDTACNVVSYKLLPYQNGYVGYHFKEEPNGLLSYMARKMDGIINVTDTAYNILTTFRDTTNPFNRIRYFAHFDLLPNGHYLTVRYDFQYTDLTKYFPKGEPNGAVLQAVVQELDKDKKVLFQWNSLDYLPVNLTYDPLAPNIDYFHPNSMVLDNDGNLLLSARDLSSIIKINRNTGEIMWVLGGKLNQFKFLDEHLENDSTYFSYQHDIRRLPNGNITLFDNGRQHKPQYSRAVEYQLNEAGKTAKLVWDYRHNPDIYADQHGSVQRMPNGNTLIAWGTYSMDGTTALTELHPDNSIALEMHFPKNLESQFIYKYPWPACPLIASVEKKELLDLNTYDFNDSKNKTGVSITFNTLNSFVYNSFSVNRYNCSPMNPEFTGRAPIVSPYRLVMNSSQIYTMEAELHISLDTYPEVFQPQKIQIYFRTAEGKGVFKPLATTYDKDKNELIAVTDTTGEFILGYPDSISINGIKAPIVYEPMNNARPYNSQPVNFSWNPRGYFTGSQIQVAKDSNFTTMVLDSAIPVINYSSFKFSTGLTYYWHVRSFRDSVAGDWSETRKFIPGEAYIKLTIPNGGEVWKNDSTKSIIRWEYNVNDSVNKYFRIDLYRNGSFYKRLKDSLFSNVNAFAWLITNKIPADSTYQIRVVSLKDTTTLSAISDNYFTIAGTTSAEDNYPEEPAINAEVFPNPFGASTSFIFNTANGGYASLKVYSIEGREIASLFENKYIEPGNYQYNWKTDIKMPGVYFYVLKIGNQEKTGKLVIIE